MQKLIFIYICIYIIFENFEVTAKSSKYEVLFPKDCGRQLMTNRNRTKRVVNGQDAAFGEYPWQVSLLKYGNNNCGGSLINNRWVLTAANCMDSLWSTINISIGEYDHRSELEPQKTVRRTVVKEILHSKYQIYGFRKGYDIALLKLNESVEFTDHIQPICLPPSRNFEKDVDRAVIAGWGTLLLKGKMSPILQEILVPIIDNELCQNIYTNRFSEAIFDNKVMCAGFTSGKATTCKGDSGSPLVIKREDGRWYALGIVSWTASDCGKSSSPIVLTRISEFMPWIRRIIINDLE